MERELWGVGGQCTAWLAIFQAQFAEQTPESPALGPCGHLPHGTVPITGLGTLETLVCGGRQSHL